MRPGALRREAYRATPLETHPASFRQQTGQPQGLCKGWSLRLHLADELARVLDGINFLNLFVTPNRFDSWKP
jgi:hypothetical protein